MVHNNYYTHTYDVANDVFSLGCTNMYDNYGNDVHALERERSLLDSFSE